VYPSLFAAATERVTLGGMWATRSAVHVNRGIRPGHRDRGPVPGIVGAMPGIGHRDRGLVRVPYWIESAMTEESWGQGRTNLVDTAPRSLLTRDCLITDMISSHECDGEGDLRRRDDGSHAPGRR
jgi:hypothetical protein